MNIIKKSLSVAASVLLSITIFSSTAHAAVYTIVPNDSLYKIGQLFNTSISTLKTDNNLSSDWIFPGQTLNVRAESYTVQNGDSIYLIAKKFGVPVTSLRQANNKWDNLIYPGQQITIPTVKPVGGTVIPYTNAEVDLLARLIMAEAGGEEYAAMVAVGGVVVNRVQSPDWPSTITSVIYHVSGGYHQFTPVKNGFIEKPASDASIRAAWAALYGSDPSKNAMFYFDDSSTNQWLWSKTITARIDNMVFVK
ncbi:LysM peptidoglycan-binding domain-containing protein [Mobilitalea sibirica]|uniref:LysM peptidoglycan-binding domain-containing protein n=1 Tax=Mobilitalea sibirica TaxID=1462919 RepID=A0A8J7HEA3_9FIRM|nr:LysM peptidoglycan-binding domain-containing protein [Mobilitalea sibirica]MBH1941794.1 LysM peptidoglycan-binding domain-containing protein [Mobilitalea sibirica]